MEAQLMELTSSGTVRPVRQQRLHERVVQQLTQLITSGTLPPGTSLPTEPELARQFGVSRTVIREAVRVLAAKRLVTVRHGSGMWIQPPEQWDYLDPLVLFESLRAGQGREVLQEILELRRILETNAAELAALRRDEHDQQTLTELITAMRQALDNAAQYIELDLAFHEAIMQAAHNRLLREARRPLVAVLRHGWQLTSQIPNRGRLSHRGHEDVYAAIMAGDPVAAREAMSRHLERFETDVRELFFTMPPESLDEAASS